MKKKLLKSIISAGAMLAASSLYAQTSVSLFNFGFSGGPQTARDATLTTDGSDAGITVGRIFDNLPISTTNVSPEIDGIIDEGSILTTRARLFIDRGGNALGFNGTGTPVSSFSITAGSGFDVTITSFSLQGVSADGAFASNTGIRWGIGVNGSLNSSLALFQTTSKTITLDTPIVISAGTTETIEIHLNSSSGASQHIVDNFNLQGFTTAAAVPEPSTYALFAGVAVLAFVVVRRKLK